MKKTVLSLLIISMMGLMTACGKNPETTTQSTAPSAPLAERVTLDPLPQVNTDLPNYNTTLAKEVQKPTQLLNETNSTNPIEQELIKTSDISFKVDDIIKATHSIELYVQEAGGYVEQKYINYAIQDLQRNAKSNGEVEVFEKVLPQAQLVVRVPNTQTAIFLNRILPLMSQFYTQHYDAKQYNFQQLQEKQKALVPSVNVSETTTTTDSTATTTKITATNVPNIIPPDLKALIEKDLQHRLQYSTIVLNYQQSAVIRTSKDFELLDVIDAKEDPLSTRLGNAMGLGMAGIITIFVNLMILWPLYALFGLAWWGYRTWKRKKSD